MNNEWLLPGATQDHQTITVDWNPSNLRLIDGVQLREVKNVPKGNGHLTEIYRSDWALDDRPVEQIFQVVLLPRQISAWHAHARTLDRLFVSSGLVQVVLYDRRQGSPTFGVLNEFKIGEIRPGLIIVPPGVWHGIQNIGHAPSAVLNIVDRAYDYESPDHWRVPHDSHDVPFTFGNS